MLDIIGPAGPLMYPDQISRYSTCTAKISHVANDLRMSGTPISYSY